VQNCLCNPRELFAGNFPGTFFEYFPFDAPFADINETGA